MVIGAEEERENWKGKIAHQFGRLEIAFSWTIMDII